MLGTETVFQLPIEFGPFWIRPESLFLLIAGQGNEDSWTRLTLHTPVVRATRIDRFADAVAILISLVSNSYYGIPREQIHN